MLTEEIVTPDPRLLESMRSVGYTVEAAVADIIDNSIAAGAERISMYASASGPLQFSIVDDGSGMDEQTAIDAMRLAARSPLDERNPQDLGRFGLGLKTASLSQCRVLTLATKQNGQVTALQWSLDHVITTGRWALIRLSEDTLVDLQGWAEFERLDHGTLVNWQDLDQFQVTEGAGQEAFDQVVANRIRDHVGLVFHRFIDGDDVAKIAIRINRSDIEPADPFLQGHRSRQVSPAEYIPVAGAQIRTQAVTLPYIKNLTLAEREHALRPGTIRDSQGFYVYRAGRLVIWGTWFRVAPRTELAKLTRVRVDVPNTLDHMWALDIKKSKAEPPPEVRRRLKELAERMIGPSKRVQTFRGRPVPNEDTVERMWRLIQDHSGFRYEINPAHPMVTALEDRLDDDSRKLLGTLLAAAETSFPVIDAHNRLSQDQSSTQDSADLDELLQQALDVWPRFKAAGATPDSFVALIMNAEPYALAPGLRPRIEKAITQ